MRYDERLWTSGLVLVVAIAVVGLVELVVYLRRRHRRPREYWTRWRGP